MSEFPAGTDAWRNWSQAELDRAYSARGTVPDAEAEIQKYGEHSAPMYTTLPCQRGLAYGPGADEHLDLFPVPGQPDAPLFLFIHGGYWRSLGRADSVFMARNFTQHGIAVAALDYSLAPAATLETMVDQCRRAVAWLYQNAPHLQVGARRRMVVAGSSAGGHLAAMVLAAGWQAAHGLPEDVVQAGILVSGLFDLAPVQRALPNTWLQLDEARAHALSPQRQLPRPGCRLHVVVAALDTPEFKRQSRAYAAACVAQGNPTLVDEIVERNHFDIILDWMAPDATLTRSALALLRPDAPFPAVRVHSDQVPWTSAANYPAALQQVVHWNTLVGAGPAGWPGVPQQDVRMGLLELQPGGDYPLHAHPAPEIYVVQSGHAEWTVGDVCFEAVPGMAIYHAPEVGHRMHNPGSEVLRAVWFWWAPGGRAEVLEAGIRLLGAPTDTAG